MGEPAPLSERFRRRSRNAHFGSEPFPARVGEPALLSERFRARFTTPISAGNGSRSKWVDRPSSRNGSEGEWASIVEAEGEIRPDRAGGGPGLTATPLNRDLTRALVPLMPGFSVFSVRKA